MVQLELKSCFECIIKHSQKSSFRTQHLQIDRRQHSVTHGLGKKNFRMVPDGQFIDQGKDVILGVYRLRVRVGDITVDIDPPLTTILRLRDF